MVYRFLDATQEQIFEALQAVNDDLLERNLRETVNVTLVPITLDQLPDWLDNNIEPNGWERTWRKIRFVVTTLARDS